MRKCVCVILICFANALCGQVIHRDKPRIIPTEYIDSSQTVNKRRSADTSKYFHIGLIPYQVLSRSLGGYAGFDFKKYIIELRTTYTRATNYLGIYFPFAYDNFYYHGLNISPVFNIKVSRRSRIRFMLFYRNWSYTDQWICVPGISPESSYSFTERKTAHAKGIGAGFEYSLDWSYRHFDFGFFTNISFTKMSGIMLISEGDYHAKQIPNRTYPITEDLTINKAVFTFGLKFGFRSKIK
ncbi:MAG: hypothetical protein ACXVPN_07170 [Bacteroidia bacterium]